MYRFSTVPFPAIHYGSEKAVGYNGLPPCVISSERNYKFISVLLN